jgi:phage terminase large subunit-like protein
VLLPTSSLTLRDAAHPRVEVAPPATDFLDGELAAKFVAAAGLVLEPWQEAGLRTMLARRPDGKLAAFEYAEICPRQNGKSALLQARALAGMFLLGEQVVLWTAHEVKTSMRAWKDLRRLLRVLGTQVNDNLIEVGGIPVKVNASNGQEGFERLDTGQEIKIAARSKGSGRGFSVDCLIADEAFALEEIHQDALLPMLQARPDPQVCYASSPPLNGLSGGPMYQLRARATAGGDETLAWRDWGLATELDELMAMPPDKRRAFLDDRERWAATNPAWGGGRVYEESILRNRRAMSEEGFAREVLGCWPKQALARGDVIDPHLWRERGDETSRPGEALVFAVDASPNGRSAAVASSGRREDGRLHVKVVDYRPGTGWVTDRIVELRSRWQPRKVLLDPAGPGGALLADLLTAGVEVEFVSGREMAQACGALVNDLKEDRIRHCNQDALNDAVAQATSRRAADAWAWDRKDTTADICPLVAATLAAHGFRLYGSQEEVTPWVMWA